MPTENDFLIFSGGSGANVETQAEYAADAALTNGVSAGVAKSSLYNKAARQASIIANTIASFIIQQLPTTAVVDNGSAGAATILANFTAAIQNLAYLYKPLIGQFSSSSSAATTTAQTGNIVIPSYPNGAKIKVDAIAGSINGVFNGSGITFAITNGAISNSDSHEAITSSGSLVAGLMAGSAAAGATINIRASVTQTTAVNQTITFNYIIVPA